MRKAVSFVLHPDSQEPVEGLRIHKQSKRYYRIDEDRLSRHFYQKKGLKNSAYLRRAIFEHECHVNGRTPNETETLIVTRPAFDDYDQEVQGTLAVYADGTEQMERYHHPDDLADYFRAKLSNPETRIDFANRLRMPELLKLDSLRPAQDSMSLVDVGELYHTKNVMKGKTRGNSRSYWTEFVEFLGVDLVSELTPRHIENYHDEIMSRYKNGEGISRSYIRNRYGVIKAAFNFAIKRGKDIEHIATVQAYLKMLKLPKQTPKQKKEAKKKILPITREHFHALLDVAETKWRAMLLLSLNCAFYPEDVCNLEKTDIDLKAQSLEDFRCKTGKDRAAWLWPETVAAFRAYLAEEPHNDSHVFVTQFGTGYLANSLTHVYRDVLRVAAGIPESVEYRHIRYGFASHAGSDLKATRIVMGQSLGGELDAYTKRIADNAKPACVAVREYYFSKSRKKG